MVLEKQGIQMKKIIVLGGGTAGWLTALFVKKFVPDVEVSVIESTQIGILGAGEGTVPHFVTTVLELLDIPVAEMFKRCDATVKLGIRFVNWNGDGESYFHTFHQDEDVYDNPCNVRPSYVPINFLHTIKEGITIASTTIPYMLCQQMKNPFIISDTKIDAVNNYALHFDAKLLAIFLKEVAISRGVNHIDDVIEDIEIENSIVKSLSSNDNRYFCDLIYDCSGLSRLVINKLNSTWISYSSHKTVDSAMPFIIPHKGGMLPPFTDSVALKYGWAWIIPTQERFGCGYVYDSKFVSDNEIKAEILENFPSAKILGKVFKFDSGYYETPWVGNCIAVGLSAGFIEPLEATSIFNTSLSIIESVIMPNKLLELDPFYIDQFNKSWSELSREIHDFVYLHYMTKRKDTEFWKKFADNLPPKSLKDDLDKWEKYPISSDDLLTRFFNVSSWFQVMQGVERLPQNIYEDIYNSMTFNKEGVEYIWNKDIEEKQKLVEKCSYNEYKKQH